MVDYREDPAGWLRFLTASDTGRDLTVDDVTGLLEAWSQGWLSVESFTTIVNDIARGYHYTKLGEEAER